MKKTLMRTVLMVGIVTLMCGFTMQAGAVTFTYEQHSGFNVAPGTLESTDASSNTNDVKWFNDTADASIMDWNNEVKTVYSPVAGYMDTVAWGVSNNEGGLMTTDPWGTTGVNSGYSAMKVLGVGGTIEPGADSAWGDWELLSRVFHQNVEISNAYFTLYSAGIYSGLDLSPTDADLAGNTVPFDFVETRNIGGSIDDEIYFPNFSFASEYFYNNGIKYELEFTIDNFVNSKQVAAGPEFTKITTEEGVTSSLDVMMRVRQVQVQVPEPATLTLLGLGLLSIGMAARRRKS